MKTSFIYTATATFLAANAAFAAQNVPVSAELQSKETYGWLWVSDASTNVSAKLIAAGDKACADLGLKLQGLDQVKITVGADGISKLPKRTETNANGGYLLLRQPSGTGSAVAICG